MGFIPFVKVAAFIAVFFSVNSTIAQVPNDNKIVIIYLSRTNNIKAVAENIQHHMGGELIPLELGKAIS